MRLLFISSRFPDSQEPERGVENVALLNALADRWEIRVVALRPVPLFGRMDFHSRATDVALRPVFQSVPCLPAIGRRWNHHFHARALRKRLGAIRRDWRFDAVLTAGLHPDACAVALLKNEFQFRFVVTAPDFDTSQSLAIPALRKIIGAHVATSAGVATSNRELIALLAQARFGQDRIHPAANFEMTVEACHRLLLPTSH